ncbi:MAG: choice-of-anchor I family protein [Pseudomonadota bacterium]
MQTRSFLLTAVVAASLVLVGCEGDDGDDGAPGAPGTQGPAGPEGPQGPAGPSGQDSVNSRIALNFLSRFETGEFDESAAEIVDYDPSTRQVFTVNANSGRVDIIDISAPTTPTFVAELDVAADIAANVPAAPAMGSVNSVSVSGDSLAAAIGADNTQANGYVAFYQTDGTFLSAVEVGALPDMVTYTPDGNTVLVANEGEPNGDYSIDPEGSVSIIDISGGEGSITAMNVATATFQDFNTGGNKALGANVRIAAKAMSVAQDLEPEFIGVSADGTTAYVMMQENNAVGVLDVAAQEITAVLGLGYKDHGLIGNELDASNRDGGTNLRSWPLRGLFMPDGFDTYEYAGTTYLVTANEGDAREYLTDASDEAECTAQGGFDFDDGDCFHYLDEIRAADLLEVGASIELPNLSRFAPDVETLLADENLGRVKLVVDQGVSGCSTDSIATTGQPGEGCVYEQLYSYGARSFSIWNGSTGALVFDSANDFEMITAQRLGEGFNASNDDNEGDDRSDDKGPEPEAVEIATLDGRTYAFIALERVGGIMVYDISNPESAEFVQYLNTRNFNVDIGDLVDAGDFSAVGDLGPESIRFISADDSPSGEPLIVVGNEVSGTTAIYSVTVVSN